MGKKRKLRSRDDGTFSYMSDALKGYITEIEGFGVAVYWFISTYTSVDKEHCWVGRMTIAESFDVDVRKVDKYLKKLESTDPPLIERVKRPGKTDKIYFLPVKQRVVSTKNAETTKNVDTVSTKNAESSLYKKCSTNKNHSNKNQRTKKHTAAKKHRSSESVSEILFENSKDKLNKQKLKDSFEYKCSVKLCDNLKSKGKIIRTKINLKEWSEHFRELMQAKTKKRIKIVLRWYLEHLRERWCPKLYCARTFCERFAKVEDAMRRKDDDALLEDEEKEQAEVGDGIETSEYTDNKGQKHIVTKTPAGEDGFPTETDEWTDKDGKKHRRSSIDYDYSEPEQDDDDED